MGRKKNTEAIVQIFILIAIACLLIYAMISKKVTYYVHPRFYFGIWISIIILILFATSLISNIKKARHNVNVKHYMIFAIPLAAALLFPAAVVNSKDMTMASSDIEPSKSEQENTNTEADKNTIDDSNTDANSNDTTSPVQNNEDSASTQESDLSEKYTQYETDGVMIINDDIFAEWMDDVYNNPNDFSGNKCQYLAQVYSMEDLKENQFLAGRYFMVCCAADLVGYGIVCESDIRSDLEDEEWITVTGTIQTCEYNGNIVPILKDVTITKAEAPAVEYIYYNNY
ncbi:MAG: TIGR03943 family protein [Candidatus Metalachnospira sp.]|nr:TIGR03943 family protein [Candidatus Metalachnospira sp.]